MPQTVLHSLSAAGIERLAEQDPALLALLERECDRQATTLSMVASSSLVDPSILACQASVAVNVTAEGYPGARFHAGCSVIDGIEQLAIDRAKQAFGAQYANVQPHSASTANEIVMFSLLQPGDTILGMELDSGGHLTHGAKVSISGRHFNAIGYGLDQRGSIDFERVRALTLRHRPKLIICGATACSRTVDFARFREIADEAGAILLADIPHIAGLVVAGLHPSPINHAHLTTTCTHKQLFGPRGGLILSSRDADTVVPGSTRTYSETIQRGVFPLSQGAPILNAIAAKARMLAIVQTPAFGAVAQRIVADAQALAARAVGANTGRIVWRHNLPNILGPTLVLVTLNLGNAILGLTALSFLGLGVQPPQAEWGAMINSARGFFDTHPWVMVAPGLAISGTVLAVNILGDAIRDATDPHRRR